ncbi:MAG TPA: anion transporter [Terriglobales bacterium]|nr:anion transporter [Terriglobales bacterium]
MSDAQIIAAWAAFASSYLVFAVGKFPGLKIDRPGAAIVGAVVMVAIKVVSPANAIRSVDFATIVLLFAMMLIVATLRLGGFFDLVAERLVAHLEPAHLLPAIIFTSGVLSAFFVNDIVCLVLAPFVILISRRMRLNPVAHLLALATASNIGSVATITGNPQNMLIGSYSGISYRSFLAHLAPVAVAGLFVDWLVLWWLWRGKLAATREMPGASHQGHEGFRSRHERGQLIKPILVMAAVLIGFLLDVPPAMMAALGAATLLVIHARDPREMYDEVDWGLLVFFVGLFVIVRGAEESGLVARLLSGFQFLNLHRPAPFSAVVVALSNLVSNVPAVMLLKSLVPQFSNARAAWLMLAMASTLAGNLTITGSVANIIVVERAREVMHGGLANSGDAHIGFREYARVGVPVTVLTVALGTLWVWWTS